MANIVGVRLKAAGKIFYFDAGDLELQVSNYVVVETSHGLAVGRVVIAPDQVLANELKDDVKPALRLATTEDIEQMEALKEKAEESIALFRRIVAEQNTGMSVAGGEYDLEGSLFTGFFTSPERVDFRNLVRDLSKELGVRVQLLQVGERDRAKLVDGVDICGERLCCSSWMTSFPSVSIRMAKEQDLPLNPQKISGVCGRLYCCLTFEFEDYKAIRGTLPKVGSFVSTPAGEAKVQGIDFNKEVARLWLTETRTMIEMSAIDLKLQHGVTVRPMELVHKIEGPLRTINEDSSADRRQRRSRAGRPESVAEPPPPSAAVPTDSGSEEAAGGQRRRRRRRRRGRGGGPASEPGPTSSE